MRLIRKRNIDSAPFHPHALAMGSAWRVLVVDDDPGILAMTRLVLDEFRFDGKGVELTTAESAAEARQILASEPRFAVALVDVVMESDDAGLRLVEYIRDDLKDMMIRIIVRTGQPGVAPERFVIDNYDIDDYKDKTELTAQMLYTSVRATLKSYRDMVEIKANRDAMEQILAVAPSIFLHDASADVTFFEAVLFQVMDLYQHLAIARGIEPVAHGFIATSGSEGEISATAGRFLHGDGHNEAQALHKGLQVQLADKRSVVGLERNILFLPLHTQEKLYAYIYLELGCEIFEGIEHPLRVMASLSSAALDNLLLHIDLQDVTTQSYHKSRFFGVISREISKPINGMMGVVQLLKYTSLNELQHEYIKTITETGKSLQTVVGNLLDLSKIGTDSLELESEQFDLLGMANEVSQLYQEQASERDISLLHQFPSLPILNLQGDARRLRQVMLYLLGSAIGQVSHGTIHFHITADDRGDLVSLLIEFSCQRGSGNPSAVVEQSNIPIDERGSLDMDLTIARELVEVMGGELGMNHTSEGQRERIWLSLTLPKATTEASQLTTDTAELQGKDEPESTEGEVINRNLFSNLRETMGLEFAELVAIYRHSVHQLLDDLERSGRLKDEKALSRHAYNLRSCCSNIGAMQMSELGRNLEMDIQHGLPVALNLKIANLRGAFSLVEDELDLLMR